MPLSYPSRTLFTVPALAAFFASCTPALYHSCLPVSLPPTLLPCLPLAVLPRRDLQHAHGCLQFAQHLMIQFQFPTPLICLILPLILPLILILHRSILFIAIQRCLGSPLTPQTLCAAIQN